MTDDERKIIESFKDGLIVALTNIYKTALGQAFELFQESHPEIARKYGKMTVNDLAQKYKEAWIYVGDKMIITSKSLEIH